MSLPRYSNYKASGVEWWGDMPESWGLFPAKRSFIRKKELNAGMKCENRLSLTLGGVVPRALDDLDGLQASEFETYQIFSADDLVFKLIDLQNIKTSRVGLVPEIGIMSPAYIRVEPNKAKITPKFAYWFFTNLYNRCIFNELGGGVRQTISSEELLLLPYPALPLAEQTQIAAFLDRETAKIDGLVAEQRRLMELLKEKRQAVISHAVTQGLNPHAPMKPSGIEWLGDVPAHWEVMSLRRCALSVQTGGTPSTEPPSTDLEEGLVWFTPGDFSDSLFLTNSTRKISSEVVAYGEAKVFPPRSVLIVSIGATLGKVGFAEQASSANQQINAVIPNERVDGYFLAYSLLVKAEVMRFLSNASTIGIMNQEKTKDIWLAVPPTDEQINITAFLDTETAKLDTLTAEAQRTIDLLQERRTALISAAVTGQIDVRGIQALPQ